MDTAAKKREQEPVALTIEGIKKSRMTITIDSDSLLCMNKFSEKQKGAIIGKQAGKAKQGRPKRDPKAEYQAAFHHHPDGGYCFPGSGFKKTAVIAASQTNGAVKMAHVRRAFHVVEDMVKIVGTPRMREDMVRLASGVCDVRYRPEFPEWSATFTVVFNENAISAEQIIALYEIAGFAVGLGENRPDKTGNNWGMFHVRSDNGNGAKPKKSAKPRAKK